MDECLRRNCSKVDTTHQCTVNSLRINSVFHCKALNIIPRFAKTGNSKLQIFFYNMAFFCKLKLLESDDAFNTL
ncbi:hypothetical protein T10_3779 [Trichinella papuae]|uniref:Uncharacterized protein n=1 Tax=Trichinella papuae TaxID=268474 RepID=A0A0V1MJ37_9BILA|nr:hypothetical protein T10_3779 [Trichinella papuae]